MSSVYATEPTTSGRVIFETTHGPLDISLWCRECPSTTKLFLQLCLDGYYDNMLFHRIVPSLLIQTGAIRSTSIHSPGVLPDEYRTTIQADEALERRQYELNTRLRFNHRGQVAMALGVSDDNGNELQPQFFITTADAPYLDEKHVLFGTLGSGSPTIFNAIRINGTAVDEGTNQPLELEHAPRVLSTKIVENEIHTDLVARDNIPWRIVSVEPQKKKKKRKGKLDVNVLSFGDEMGDVGQEEASLAKLGKRSDKSRISYPASQQRQDRGPNTKRESAVNAEKSSTPPITPKVPAHSEEAESRMHDAVAREVKKAPQPVVAEEHSEPQESLVELRRSKYAKRKKSKQEREEHTLQQLAAFQQKIGGAASAQEPEASDAVDNSLAARMARREEEKRRKEEDQQRDTAVSYHGQILESDGDEDQNTGWIATKFKCRRHIDHSAGADGRNVSEYDVIDEQNKRSQKHDKHSKKHKKRKHS